MVEFLLYFAVAFVVFFAIDIVWLGLVARKVYKKYLSYIMAEKVRWIPALVFYVIFIAGLVYFVLIVPTSLTWYMALLNGAIFGFIAYATYDLTNLSTLKGWPLEITFIDLAWGTTLGALVSLLTFVIVG